MAKSSKTKSAELPSSKEAPKKKTVPGSNSKASQEQQPPEKLDEFMVDSLKDIYWAEKHLLKVLAKNQKAATSQELKEAFSEHQELTQEHVTRLEQVFEILGKKASGKRCEAMEGLAKEAETVVEETDAGSLTRDVALIIAAQKMEHYEIAAYGGLATIAKTMGQTEIAELLAQTLQEEKDTDQLLTQLAETSINGQAAGKSKQGYADDEEDEDEAEELDEEEPEEEEEV